MAQENPDPQAAPDETEASQAARQQFERGLLDRGEAAPANPDGSLPAGVTHEIVGYDSNQQPILQRRRFSAF